MERPTTPQRDANEVIERELDRCLIALELEFAAHVIAFSGPIVFSADDEVRDALEARGGGDRLVFVLETEGGYIEVAERIATVTRRHYNEVEFVVPNFAMSAGTVLVMSGDAIHMDYYSILGPIDPQVAPSGGDFLPALGYLTQYERLIEKSKAGELTTAEMTFLISKFDPAELYQYEQERALSISLLENWLVQYKFKNWRKTRTRKKRVTPAIRRRRATEIAERLNETERWHSHNRGISMEVLRNNLNLEIEDFGGNPDRNEMIRSYHKLLTNYMAKRSHVGVVHTAKRYRPFLVSR